MDHASYGNASKIFRPSKFKEVLDTFVNSALLQEASTSGRSTARTMKKVLQNNSFAYLRAFCWMSFADYVPGMD